MALSNPLNGDRVPGTVGLPLPGVEVKISPDDPSNPRVGELLVKGPQVFLEYFGKPEATKQAFDQEGWFLTGDSVEKDPSTNVFKILGRRSVDVLKSGGYKISALDIEAILLEHDLIAECAVVGIPDEEYGQVIGAIVALKPGTPQLSIVELNRWARDRIAPYKIPRLLLALNEIPRNAMGKVNKKELVKLFELHQEKVQRLRAKSS
jgi:malonyl-CoA/methylmalonyl-CoA synthetase